MKTPLPYLFLPFILLSGALYPQSKTIPWPVSCEPGMTSAFGDYRPGHFHSGVDIKTWGKTGFPITSEGDGYVFRVGISTRGYGKALYIKLNDGGYRVYGHLSEFGPGIDSLVRNEQYARKRYSVQLYFKKGQIPVKKGQVIAKSGNTGIGFPHLHYEQRTDSNIPENALNGGLKVQDKRPPVLEQLAIKPFLLGSVVDGSEDVVVCPFVKTAGDTFRTRAPVVFYGCAGLAIKGYDMADAAENHFGIYALSLYLDDSLIFSSVRDSFPFEETQQIHLDYDLPMIYGGFGPFYNLYVEDGNKLPFYGPFKEESGLIRVVSVGQPGIREGRHTLRIVSSDAAGNSARAVVTLVCVNPPVLEMVEWKKENGSNAFWITVSRGNAGVRSVTGSISTDGIRWKDVKSPISLMPGGRYRAIPDTWPSSGFYFKSVAMDSSGCPSIPLITPIADNAVLTPEPDVELRAQNDILHILVRTASIPVATPGLAVYADSTRLAVPLLRSRTAGVYETRFRIGYAGSKLLRITLTIGGAKEGPGVFRKDYVVSGLVPGSNGQAVSIDKRAFVDVPARAVVREACLWLVNFTDSIRPGTLKEIKACGPAFAPQPRSLYYDHGVYAAILASRQARTGLFTYAGENGWQFLSRDYDAKKGCYTGRMMQNFPFGLFADTVAPSITPKTPSKAGEGVSVSELLLYVKDEGAGIGSDEDVVALMDGLWILSEYDFKDGAVKISLRGLSMGPHVLTLKAKDNLENESNVDLPFIRL